MPEAPDDNNIYRVNVTNLRPYSNYRLRMRAENQLGTSTPSEPTDSLTTGPIKPDMYPDQLGGGGGECTPDSARRGRGECTPDPARRGRGES